MSGVLKMEAGVHGRQTQMLGRAVCNSFSTCCGRLNGAGMSLRKTEMVGEGASGRARARKREREKIGRGKRKREEEEGTGAVLNGGEREGGTGYEIFTRDR